MRCVFVDIRSAFYTVLRQAFVSIPDQHCSFFAAMHHLGMTQAEIQALVQDVQHEAVAAGLSPHMQFLLHNILQGTYFQVPGISTPCQTTRGTRPGDPIADILFNLCMTAILKDVHAQMTLVTDIQWIGKATPIPSFDTGA